MKAEIGLVREWLELPESRVWDIWTRFPFRVSGSVPRQGRGSHRVT